MLFKLHFLIVLFSAPKLLFFSVFSGDEEISEIVVAPCERLWLIEIGLIGFSGEEIDEREEIVVAVGGEEDEGGGDEDSFVCFDGFWICSTDNDDNVVSVVILVEVGDGARLGSFKWSLFEMDFCCKIFTFGDVVDLTIVDAIVDLKDKKCFK